ncbi:MAG: aquaporin Z [Actinomycetota bacterium]|nr:aquaporin Z [Actinomycetota bacterium]
MTDALVKRLGAEFLGTFWLVFGGCGTAVLAATFPKVGVGLLGVALAFGLTVLTMAYAVGNVSGGHFNPAVTVGLALAKRFPWADVLAYVVTQIAAAIVAASALWAVAHGQKGFSSKDTGFAANGYGDHSPGHYSLWAALIIEVLMTAFFLYIILGATDVRATAGFAPIAIGLGLTLIHLISIPIDNTSVNPARSIGPALYAGGWAIGQLWLFIVGPIAGAAIAGTTYYYIVGGPGAEAFANAPDAGPRPRRR